MNSTATFASLSIAAAAALLLRKNGTANCGDMKETSKCEESKVDRSQVGVLSMSTVKHLSSLLLSFWFLFFVAPSVLCWASVCLCVLYDYCDVVNFLQFDAVLLLFCGLTCTLLWDVVVTV